jgi:hypothetical protein
MAFPQGDAMTTRFQIVAATLAFAALAAGCMTEQHGTSSNTAVSGAAADRQCQVFRSYRDRPYVNVMEECTRQLGEAACRACLQ